MSPAQRQKCIDKAQLQILFNLPFFAPGVMQLPVVWDDTVKTACTDGKVIRWNGPWFDSLKQEERTTVLCHEVMHNLYGHCWRAPAGADHEDWNIACDHAVNLQLDEFSKQVTGRGLADPFPFPPGACVKDPVFSGVAEEAIYSRIHRPKPPAPGGGGAPGQGGSPAPGQFGQVEIALPGSKPDKATQEKWEAVLVQSCAIAKSKGKLPGGMERLVKELLEPAVPWWILLRQWLAEQASDDWNWMKPNLQFGDSGFILPSLESEKIGAIVFATDTSGSIDADALAHFQSEKQNCLDELRPAKLVDIYCDSAIHKVKEYGPGETIDRDAPGGGGTSFCPVFELANNLDPAPKCLVYLTDLYGDFPDKAPDYPVLWITWNDQVAPFGVTVRAGN